MDTTNRESEYKRCTDAEIAVEILRRTGVDVVEAALIARAALKAGRGRTKRAYECIAVGERELQRREKTVTFARAVEVALSDCEKRGRRRRTLSDLHYMAVRLMRRCPDLARHRVRSICAADCAKWIEQAFSTPVQCRKARTSLSAIFAAAIRHGWCAENPARAVPVPVVKEHTIRPLSQAETERLIAAAEEYRGGICLAAVAIMLYAGVRPKEVARMTWEQVHLREGVITILPEHSKTGGARQVTIQPALTAVLRRVRSNLGAAPLLKLCPPNWERHWTELHRAAGWTKERGTPWQPDVLRHTFATNHLRTHHDYRALQYEMGHRNSDLLRTRYVAL